MSKQIIQIVIGSASGDKLNEYNDEAFKNWNEKVLLPCPNCGRTFLPDRLEVHLRSCKGKGGELSSPQPIKGKAPLGGIGGGSDSKMQTLKVTSSGGGGTIKK